MDDLLKLETETFNKLYTDYRLRFIRFAQTYILDISIAEDIVMDTLAYYWEHRRDIKNDENILSYLLTAIKHKCLNYLRQERFHYEKNNSLSELALWELDFIIRKSKFPQNPKRSVRFSGKRTKRSVQKRKARNTQKAETKVL